MRQLRQWLVLLFALCLSLQSFGTAVAQTFDRYVLPGDKVYPEGIAYQPSTGDFFVSSTTDGTILRGNINQAEAKVFLPGGSPDGPTSPRGLKVDGRGRLYICGGPQGTIFVYDIASAKLLEKFSPGVANAFCNDLSVAPDGSVYATDSNAPYIYRISSNNQGKLAFEQWLNVSPTISYTTGFNLGGIAVTPGGRYLLVAQGNIGKIFRVDLSSKAIVEVDMGGTSTVNADGLWLDGQTLYVVRNSNRLLVSFQMSSDYSKGTVFSTLNDPSFAFPTTLAKAGSRILIVNAQFDKRNTNNPVLPFSVSSIEAPVAPGSAPAIPLPNTGPETAPGLLFPQTGFMVSGAFLSFWRANGALPIYGYPIDSERQKNGQIFQWFERNRFELHPEKAYPYNIELGLLGSETLARKGIDWAQLPKVTSAPSGCRYFAQTGHSLCGDFLDYWQRYGLDFDGQSAISYGESLALFGYPISEPKMETNSSGDTVVTQWFERARFEYHPNNPAQYRVQLGLLGTELFQP